MATRTSRALSFRTAPYVNTSSRQPVNQPRQTVVLPKHIDTAAEYDAVLDSSGNRTTRNDLYDRVNFLRTGRRSPEKF